MPEELLDRPDVVAIHQNMGREGMTKSVAGGLLTMPAHPGGAQAGFLSQRVSSTASPEGGRPVAQGASPGKKHPMTLLSPARGARPLQGVSPVCRPCGAPDRLRALEPRAAALGYGSAALRARGPGTPMSSRRRCVQGVTLQRRAGVFHPSISTDAVAVALGGTRKKSQSHRPDLVNSDYDSYTGGGRPDKVAIPPS